jgi:hypothetical protein
VATIIFLLPIKINKNCNGLDVSVTSYGWRILTVGIAITSFCFGSNSIRNVYFTIDEEEYLNLLKLFLLRWLKIKGVNIIRGPRRGTHSKYWYYLHNYWDGHRPFMLIDDDVIYDRNTADILFKAAQGAEGNVCVRSLICKIDGDRISPYKTWHLCRRMQSGYEVFATNVGGVVISSKFARQLIKLGEAYRKHCNTVDDIWFHWVSLRYEMPYTQAVSKFCNPVPIPFTQGNALSNTINVSGNDQALCLQYDEIDINKIISSQVLNGEKISGSDDHEVARC